MQSEPQLNRRQLEIITCHNGDLLQAIETEIRKLEAIKDPDLASFVKGQLLYWKHAKSTLQWSLKIARQKAGMSPNV